MALPLLYVTHRVPHPPDRGDRIRNWNVLRFLAKRAPVWLACLVDEPIADETRRVLEENAARIAFVRVGRGRWFRAAGSVLAGRSISEGAFASAELRRVLRDWATQSRFAGAIVSASSLAPYLQMPELMGVPGVVDLVDVDSQKWFDYAAASAFPRSLIYRLEGSRLRRLERELPSWARAVLLVSEAESALYREFTAPGPVHTVTNGVDLDFFRPQVVQEEPACTFVGALDYKPNVDAVTWFAMDIWPELHQGRPELRFRVVGRRPTAAVRRLDAVPGVEVIGPVPDVRPWLARSAVVVAPLRIARGVQNKVLEALAMTKACVASRLALNGVRARPSVELLAATTPAEWVDSITRLLDDASLRQKLGTAGRAFVETHHRWDACLQPLAEILNIG
jgi:sugar transferase (PEP-CTERM/EpsH1 system associated)